MDSNLYGKDVFPKLSASLYLCLSTPINMCGESRTQQHSFYRTSPTQEQEKQFETLISAAKEEDNSLLSPIDFLDKPNQKVSNYIVLCSASAALNMQFFSGRRC